MCRSEVLRCGIHKECTAPRIYGPLLHEQQRRPVRAPFELPTTNYQLEGLSSRQRPAGDRVAMLAGLGELRLLRRRIRRAAGERADARAEVRAIAQRVDLDADDGDVCRERGSADALAL